MILPLYRLGTNLAAPWANHFLSRRAIAGKEDAARLAERRGVAAEPRPPGFLTWVHGASVGEAQSALPLIDRLLARGPVLMTTGTVTSAGLMRERLPPGARHQFVPVDRPAWVGRFLDHWRPDLALWLESELWPNLVLATRARGTPMVLVNGRMSERSFRRWRWAPGTIRTLLGAFDLCLAQSEASAERFRALGAGRVAVPGNLKFAAPPLPVDPGSLEALRAAIGDRPRWLAASTHDGEEAIAGRVHQALAPRFPGLVTIIAPRHPARGAAIAAELPGRVRRRAAHEAPDGDIYVADTLGELGLLYSLSPIAFIGRSLAAGGGQNPLEAARFGCAVLHGPEMANFREAVALIGDAAREVADEAALTGAVGELLADPAAVAARGAEARRRAQAGAGALDAVLAALAPYLAHARA